MNFGLIKCGQSNNLLLKRRTSLTFGKLGVTDLVGDGEDAVDDGK